MRLTALCAAMFILGIPAAVMAADATNPISGVLSTLAGDVPDGWSRNMDGSYRHAQSGVLCPRSFKGFTFKSMEGPSRDNANVLGTCLYSDGSGRVGSIRIRRFAGAEDTGPLADNDKLLMAADNPPPMLLHTGIDRSNGGGRVTATVARKGLLVDCSVWHPEHTVPKSDFLLYCTTIPA